MQEKEQEKSTPHANHAFVLIAFVVANSLFRLYFRFTRRRNSQKLNELLNEGRQFIVIFNHTSHLDVPLVGIAVGLRIMYNLCMPGKKELFADPKTRWIANLSGAIPLDREITDTTTARILLRALRNGQNLLIAPEGTRSLDGKLQPFKIGFVKLAHKANVLILPVAIRGAAEAMPKGVTIPRPRKISVIVGDPIDPREHLGAKPDNEAVTEFTEMVRQTIAALSAQ
ncbi:MAG: 1-acyl-sn-glycerol-3-phosphate acyltransferase [Chloroflexi bacterium]|nr:1-acyl-sn-glycerol-3-phosphate acyltransferase [Chloroflexota bacterium]